MSSDWDAIGTAWLWLSVQVTVVCLVATAAGRLLQGRIGDRAGMAGTLTVLLLTAAALFPWDGWQFEEPSIAARPVASSAEAIRSDAGQSDFPFNLPPTADESLPLARPVQSVVSETDAGEQASTDFTFGWRPAWFAWAAAIASGIGFCRLLIGLGWVRRLRRNSRPLSALERERALDGITGWGDSRRFPLRVSGSLASPAIIGVLQPVVLLPSDWREWSDEDRRAAVAHEIAHLSRRDPTRQFLAELTRAIHFLNPAVHLLARQFLFEREAAADAAAAAGSGDRKAYVSSLARLALFHDSKAAKRRRSLHTLATAGTHTFLNDSISRRLTMLKINRPRSFLAAGLIGVLTVTSGVLMAGFRGEPAASPVVEPLAAWSGVADPVEFESGAVGHPFDADRPVNVQSEHAGSIDLDSSFIAAVPMTQNADDTLAEPPKPDSDSTQEPKPEPTSDSEIVGVISPATPDRDRVADGRRDSSPAASDQSAPVLDTSAVREQAWSEAIKFVSKTRNFRSGRAQLTLVRVLLEGEPVPEVFSPDGRAVPVDAKNEAEIGGVPVFLGDGNTAEAMTADADDATEISVERELLMTAAAQKLMTLISGTSKSSDPFGDWSNADDFGGGPGTGRRSPGVFGFDAVDPGDFGGGFDSGFAPPKPRPGSGIGGFDSPKSRSESRSRSFDDFTRETPMSADGSGGPPAGTATFGDIGGSSRDSTSGLSSGGRYAQLRHGQFFVVEHSPGTSDGEPVYVGSFSHAPARLSLKHPPQGRLGVAGDLVLSKVPAPRMGAVEFVLPSDGEPIAFTVSIGTAAVGGEHGYTVLLKNEQSAIAGPLPPGRYKVLVREGVTVPSFEDAHKPAKELRFTVQVEAGQRTIQHVDLRENGSAKGGWRELVQGLVDFKSLEKQGEKLDATKPFSMKRREASRNRNKDK